LINWPVEQALAIGHGDRIVFVFRSVAGASQHISWEAEKG
jgi:hypothetical protein